MGGCASKPKESDIPETSPVTENDAIKSKNVEPETVSQEKADEVVAEKKEDSSGDVAETQKEAEPAKPAEAEPVKPAEAEPAKPAEAEPAKPAETEPAKAEPAPEAVKTETGTPKQEEAATKTKEEPLKKLWSLDQNFDECLKLLDETDAANKMLQQGSFCLDLSSIRISLVESGIRHARRRMSLRADQALEMASLLRVFEKLQLDLKAAIKQDGEWYKRFLPISEMIMLPVINRSFVKLVEQVIDNDGTIKDSASSALRQSRERVRTLERKVFKFGSQMGVFQTRVT